MECKMKLTPEQQEILNGARGETMAKVMQTLLEGCKDITLLTPVVRIMSALGEESRAQLEQLAQAIAQG